MYNIAYEMYSIQSFDLRTLITPLVSSNPSYVLYFDRDFWKVCWFSQRTLISSTNKIGGHMMEVKVCW